MSHAPQTEGSNAPETDHGEDDFKVQVLNQEFFSEMIRQTASQNDIDLSCNLDTTTWKENMLSIPNSAMENYKEIVENR
ncbi:hypothetical protein LWI29_007109 [Acer saccharum]|uniref:Uncharacterized protein n=1 Tax=Acer saccharum TaxID=4024 RepID=A0AA39RMV9_ACESA|nr:hypothetical protein LWI29_007109 [Acer saccharum]